MQTNYYQKNMMQQQLYEANTQAVHVDKSLAVFKPYILLQEQQQQ